MMRLPNQSQRLAVIGKTGSGKTQAGLWHLSEQDLQALPWLIINFKRDPMISRIPGLQTIAVDDALPSEDGLYQVTPHPQQDDELTDLFWRIWEREGMGVFIDEGYMVPPRNDAYNALITQGRTKRIPIITLVQRPVWVSRFVLSESEFLQVFQLNDERDRDTVASFFPSQVDLEKRLPAYHSYYYDVAADEVVVLKPVPSEAEILAAFEEQLVPEVEEPKPVDGLRFV